MILFLQVAVILAATRAGGWAAQRWLHQPPVIGEMVAGVLLGPSLLGTWSPAFSQFLFPAESRGMLEAVAQLGIALYMFLVGLEFRVDHFRANARSAIAVSASGLVFPFLTAALATPLLLRIPGLFGEDVTPFQATLFLGTTIAITALPVLARILRDRGIHGSVIGTVCLSAAAMDDAVAWCALAVVLASVSAGTKVAWLAVGGGLCFAAAVLLVAPKLLAAWARRAEAAAAVDSSVEGVVYAVPLLLFATAAFVADYIGLHAVFGAFLIGTVMPRGSITHRLKAMLEPFTVMFLLPLYFAISGLNTHLGAIGTVSLMLIAVALLGAAVFSKFVACWAAARIAGHDNASALGIGALMNARGLTGLVVLNIGLSAGIITPTLFSMLVIMAIVTTLMASPLYAWFRDRASHARPES